MYNIYIYTYTYIICIYINVNVWSPGVSTCHPSSHHIFFSKRTSDEAILPAAVPAASHTIPGDGRGFQAEQRPGQAVLRQAKQRHWKPRI